MRAWNKVRHNVDHSYNVWGVWSRGVLNEDAGMLKPSYRCGVRKIVLPTQPEYLIHAAAAGVKEPLIGWAEYVDRS